MIKDIYLEEDYLDWVFKELNLVNPKIRLIKGLNHTNFLWVLDEDRRRASDGLTLRKKFPRFNLLEKTDKISPCTVFEMLAALAIRMDKEWIGNASENRAFLPFRDMLRNLNLTGNKWNSDNFEKVNDWMHRRFLPDGIGGIFPLRHPTCDQRDLEIWRQMLSYIDENY